MISDEAQQRLIENNVEEVQRAYRKLRKDGGGISGRGVCANIPWDRDLERETERWKAIVIVYTEEEAEEVSPYIQAVGEIIRLNREDPTRTSERAQLFEMMRQDIWSGHDALHQKLADLRKAQEQGA
jgi:hypothetical protein